jgi:hypothetical protein
VKLPQAERPVCDLNHRAVKQTEPSEHHSLWMEVKQEGPPMLAHLQFSPPSCPECGRPMRLVHVLANAHVYPPVRTFECAACEKDTILQMQPTPLRHGNGRQFSRSSAS